MKTKLGIKFLIIPIIITLFLLIPDNIVWGGHSFQTVPTIGPSNTPTRTKTYTATQPISTQTSLNISTSTVAFISPATATTTSTVKATQPTHYGNPATEKNKVNSCNRCSFTTGNYLSGCFTSHFKWRFYVGRTNHRG